MPLIKLKRLNAKLAEKRTAAWVIIDAAKRAKRELSADEVNALAGFHAACAELQVEIAAISKGASIGSGNGQAMSGSSTVRWLLPAPQPGDEVVRALVDLITRRMSLAQGVAAAEEWEAICVARGWSFFPDLTEVCTGDDPT